MVQHRYDKPTPCEKAGIFEGDYCVMLEDYYTRVIGQIVQLTTDDGSDIPYWNINPFGEEKRHAMYIHRVKLVTKEYVTTYRMKHLIGAI